MGDNAVAMPIRLHFTFCENLHKLLAAKTTDSRAGLVSRQLNGSAIRWRNSIDLNKLARSSCTAGARPKHAERILFQPFRVAALSPNSMS